jgi:predicted kinase
MKNRNRKGQFRHFDREYKTAAERIEFRAAESQLMERNRASYEEAIKKLAEQMAAARERVFGKGKQL